MAEAEVTCSSVPDWVPPTGSGPWDVAYTRYSSLNQRDDSCSDQERNIRTALTHKGIAQTGLLVLRDEAQPGMVEDRRVYSWLVEQIKAGKIGLLAVDDQGRLSRGDNVSALLQDLMFAGGRFLSVEGIDSDVTGWKMLVKIHEIKNSASNDERANQVRRGKIGRVLDGGSAGDFPFGYRSEFIDDSNKNHNGRGPKPKKRVVIFEPEAEVIRQVCRWYAEGVSMHAIARRLNEAGTDKGHRSRRPGWRHDAVRHILENPKYIGKWTYGQTTIIRNSRGKKKVIPSDPVFSDRPELRIIDDQLWAQVHARLEETRSVYGYRPGQKRRGGFNRFADAYPRYLLSGLLSCGDCGSALKMLMGGRYRTLGCPLRPQGRCKSRLRVPYFKAERLICTLVRDLIREWPECFSSAIKSMRAELENLVERAPGVIRGLEDKRAQLIRSIDRLVNALADGQDGTDRIRQKIGERDSMLKGVERQLAAAKSARIGDVRVPDQQWIEEQFRDFASLLQSAPGPSAGVLRKLLGKVTVHDMDIPGKTRGYKQLRFRLQVEGALSIVFGKRLPKSLTEAVNGELSDRCPEFKLNIGGPSKMDIAAPTIADLRVAGKSWKEIGKEVGLHPGNAFTAWKRFMKAKPKENDAA
jgi:site-specific DNA recombinase